MPLFRKRNAEAALSSTKDAVIFALAAVKESSDAFPPLKSAVSAVLVLAETVDVSLIRVWVQISHATLENAIH